MKNTDKLRILAMETCINSNIPSKTKKKHLNYIKESDPYVCIGYILDGKFYNLNENGKKELKKRFLKEQNDVNRKHTMSQLGKSAGGIYGVASVVHYAAKTKRIMPVSSLLAIAIMYGGGLIIWSTYRWIRSWFDDATKKCGTLKVNDPQRQICMQKVKEQYNSKMATLSAKANKIKQTGKKLSKEEVEKNKKKLKK